MTKQKPSGKQWMWGLTATIVASIAFFVGFAIWTFQDDVELVYDNYYDKDIVFDQQIKRVARTNGLPIKPVLNYSQTTQMLAVKFPLALGHTPTTGEVLLFRPADLHKDRLFPLELKGDSLQAIALPDMDSGLWRIKLSWTSGEEEYYLEQSLMVN